jgi:hypothetical protein
MKVSSVLKPKISKAKGASNKTRKPNVSRIKSSEMEEGLKPSE